MIKSVASDALPKFTSREGHDKFQPATEEDLRAFRVQPLVLKVLDDVAQRKSGRQNVFVLDFGCGRGLTVATLRRMGFRAFGVDIVDTYIRNSKGLFPCTVDDFPPTSLLTPAGRSMFDGGFFDVVISDQVFEHVSDLEAVVAEIDRVTAADGVGVHFFPPRFSLIEVHIIVPLVHWLPKGRLQEAAIAAAMRLGFGAIYFREHPISERIKIFSQFIHDETFYRSEHEIVDLFARRGMRARHAGREKLIARGGHLGRLATLPIVGSLGAWLYGTLLAKALITEKEPVTV